MVALLQFLQDRQYTLFCLLGISVAIAIFRQGDIPVQLLPDIEDRTFIVRFRMADNAKIEQLQAVLAALEGVSHIDRAEGRLEGTRCELTIRAAAKGDLEGLQFLVQERLNRLLEDYELTKEHPIVAKRTIHRLPLTEIHIVPVRIPLRAEMAAEVIPEIRKVPGVGNIEIRGRPAATVALEADEESLEKMGLSAGQLREFISRGERQEYTTDAGVRRWVMSYPGMPADRLINQDIAPGIRLSGAVPMTPVTEYPGGEVIKNGQNIISLKVYQLPATSAINLMDSLRTVVAGMNRSRDDFRLEIYKDQATLLVSSLQALGNAWVIAVMSSFFVIGIVARSVALGFAVTLTIACSTVLAVLGLLLLQLPFNIFTLGGTVISVGLLVDNPIVAGEILLEVPENAGLKETGQRLTRVFRPLVVSNVTTLLSFLPLLFLGGVSSDIFGGIFIVLTISLLSSLALSFTLVPLVFLLLPRGRYRIRKRNGTPPGFMFDPAATLIVTVSISLAGFLTIQYLPMRWMPSSASEYFRAELPDAGVQAGVNAAVSVTDVIRDNKVVREIRLVSPAEEYGAGAVTFTAAGDPYSHLFSTGEATCRWYPLHDPPGPLWQAYAAEFSPKLLIRDDYSVQDQETEPGPARVGDRFFRVNSTKDPTALARRNSVSVVAAREVPVRYVDALGEFKRIPATMAGAPAMAQARIIREGDELSLPSGGQVWLAVAASTVLILLYAYIHFRSWVFAFSLLILLPMGVSGGLLFLFLFGESLNLLSGLAFFIAVGISLNDAILMLEAFRENRGMTYPAALKKACRDRIRPIILTSLTTLCSCLAMFATGSFAASLQFSVVVVIMGGILVSTFAAALSIPALLRLLHRWEISEAYSRRSDCSGEPEAYFQEGL